MHSVLGTILDPAADKTLMTTLTVTLALKGLLPGKLPLPEAHSRSLDAISSFVGLDHYRP